MQCIPCFIYYTSMASCRWMCNIVWTSPSRTIFLILTNCGSDMYRATVQCCTRISIKPLPSYHATTVSRTHVLLVIECTSKVFVKWDRMSKLIILTLYILALQTLTALWSGCNFHFSCVNPEVKYGREEAR